MSDNNNLDANATDLNEFKKLQQRLNHESIKHQFRTKAFGGLHEEDVTKFIEDLEDKFKKLEQENKKASDEIYTLRTRLNTELEQKDCLQINLDEVKHDLNNYLVEFKQKEFENKCCNEKYNSENILLKREIQQMAEERKELEKVLNESNMEIDQYKEYASKFENDYIVLKTEITRIPLLNNEILKLEEERKTLEKFLFDTNVEKEKINKCVEEYEYENNSLKIKISDLSEEISQFDVLKNDNNHLIEEIKAFEELLSSSSIEYEQVKENSVKFQNENNALKIRVAELSEENIQMDVLKNENKQMVEEFKIFEELLNQSSFEYEQIKKHAEIIGNENVQMKEKLVEIEKNISSKDIKINEINRVCMDLKHQLEIEKSCSEKLNMDLVIFKQKIASLQETVNEKLQELDQQKKANEKAELELNNERASLLNYKVNGFKEEFSEMYKKIDNLEYEATQYLKSGSILQKQLAKEQNRAEKAENDLATFMNMLSGVKDKFNNGQNPFENEFAELVEKQVYKKQDSIISLDTLKKINSN